MKSKIRVVAYLPRRLYRVLEDIAPLFEDAEANDPQRGAITRALEYILQLYMESEAYLNKKDIALKMKEERWHLFQYFSKKERELQKILREQKGEKDENSNL